MSEAPAEEARAIVVAGASGVVGRHLVERASATGRTVRVLTRGGGKTPLLGRGMALLAGVNGKTWAEPVEVHTWDPGAAAAGDAEAVTAIARALAGADAVFNLAGASLSEGRLGTEHRRRVLNSRLDATRALGRGRAACDAPPRAWINASAVGYYGDTGEAEVDEEAPRGSGFLAAVCERWEEAARGVAGDARLCLGRIGLVLADDAPAWQALLKPIKLGVGGPLGSGEQWWAWIDADDLARALLFLADRPDAEGAFNLTAPHPVRQADLTWETALLARRPALLRAPDFALRLVLGEVADALLLPSCRALPRRLRALGFEFDRANIGRELMALVGDG